MATKKTVIRKGVTILGSLDSGTGDPMLTRDATSKEVGSVPAIDTSNYLSTALAAGYIFVGNGSNIATAVLPTGAWYLDSSGNTFIAAGAISNSHVAAAAGITYGKLNLLSSIVNNDISPTANIARSKLAAGTAYRILVNDATGLVSENATLTPNRVITSTATGQLQSSSVTDTTLSYLDVSSSLTTLLASKLTFVQGSVPATGDVLYYNGTNWTNLPAGVAGYALVTNGAGFAPSWSVTPSAAYNIVKNAGTPLTSRANLNFKNGLTAADNTPDTDVKWGGQLTEDVSIDGPHSIVFGDDTQDLVSFGVSPFVSPGNQTSMSLTGTAQYFFTTSAGPVVTSLLMDSAGGGSVALFAGANVDIDSDAAINIGATDAVTINIGASLNTTTMNIGVAANGVMNIVGETNAYLGIDFSIGATSGLDIFAGTGTNGATLRMGITAGQSFKFTNSGSFIVDDQRGTPRGIEYNADYSATFNGNSLVTKTYVTSLTGATGAWKLATGGTFTGNNVLTGTGFTLKGVWDALGTTPTDGYGWWLANTTAAAAGAQQISPAITWEGQGWKTNATAASQSVKITSYVLPVQGTANPSAILNYAVSVNGSAYTNALQFKVSSGGISPSLMLTHGAAWSTGIKSSGADLTIGADSGGAGTYIDFVGNNGGYIFSRFLGSVVAGDYRIAFGTSTTTNATFYILQNALSSGFTPVFKVAPGAHTNVNVNLIDYDFGGALVTNTITAGSTVQYGAYFRKRGWTAGSSLGITTGYGVYIEAPEVVNNVTMATAYGLYVNAGTVSGSGSITNNWAAGFNGNVQLDGSNRALTVGTNGSGLITIFGVGGGMNAQTWQWYSNNTVMDITIARGATTGGLRIGAPSAQSLGQAAYTAVQVGGNLTAAFSSGSGTTIWHQVSPTNNYTGTFSGSVIGYDYNPTNTSVTGVTHYGYRAIINNTAQDGNANQGLLLSNQTAAVSGVGNQRYSPSLILEGQGFRTTGSVSVSARVAQWAAPVQGTSDPTVKWFVASSINNSSLANPTPLFSASSDGVVEFPLGAANTLRVANNTPALTLITSNTSATPGGSTVWRYFDFSNTTFAGISTSLMYFVYSATPVNATTTGNIGFMRADMNFTAAVNVVGYDWNPTNPGNISGTHIAYRSTSGGWYHEQNSLAVNTAPSDYQGIYLRTPTTTTVSNTNYHSPGIVFEGQGWDTDGSVSKFAKWQEYLSVASAISPNGTFTWRFYNQDNGAYNTAMTYTTNPGGQGLDVTGKIAATGAITAGTSVTAAFGSGFILSAGVMTISGASSTISYAASYAHLFQTTLTGLNADRTIFTIGNSTFTGTSGAFVGRTLYVNPTWNVNSGGGTFSGTLYGIDYNPVNTSLTGATHIALRTVTGQILFANASGDTVTASTRLDVRGTGASSSTYSLRIANSSNSQVLSIRDDGAFLVGNVYVFPSSNNFNPSLTGTGLAILSVSTLSDNAPTFSVAGQIESSTTGTKILAKITSAGYNPTAGTAGTFTNLLINSPINTTGGTSTVYGIDYNPTITGTTGLTHTAIRATSGNLVLYDKAVIGNTAIDANSTLLINQNKSINSIRIDGAALTSSSPAGIYDIGDWTISSASSDAYYKHYISGTINATNGSHSFNAIFINPTYTAVTGDAIGFGYQPTVTSVTGRNIAVFADNGGMTFNGKTTPAQITANQNDYNPTDIHKNMHIRISSDAARDITGIVPGGNGEMIVLHNVGSFSITLKNQSASSTAANRFAFNADIVMASDTSLWLWYDSTSTRWRAMKV